MGTWILYKNGDVVNTIVADHVDPTGPNWDEAVNSFDLPVEPVEPVEKIRLWSTNDVRNNLLLKEKVKWDTDSVPEIITAKMELQNPINLIKITEILDLLVEVNVISLDTKINILS